MRITSVELHPFNLPLREPFRIATMTSTHAHNVLACIKTDSGLEGWGEASPLRSINGETQATVLAAAADLAHLLIGRDPRSVHALAGEMEAFLPGQDCAACALETALWDLAAQAAGMPLWQFLGGELREMPTDMTIPIVGPQKAAALAEEFRDKGFGHIKIKLGDGVWSDFERVESVRSAVGPDMKIRVDANQGYQRDDALLMLSAIAELDIEFCEQPVRRRDLDGMAHLAAFSEVPIMADESLFSPRDAVELIERKAASMFNVKLTKSRGIGRALEIASIASHAYLPCMMGGMVESRLGVTAAAHAACSRPVFRFFDLDAHKDHAEDPILGGIRIEQGNVLLPDEPGLGAKPDLAWLGAPFVTINA